MCIGGCYEKRALGSGYRERIIAIYIGRVMERQVNRGRERGSKSNRERYIKVESVIERGI